MTFGIFFNRIENEQGFTLVEIIAVLIILSVLAAIVVPRFIDLDANARIRAIDSALAELNGRESLTWANLKISQTGYRDGDQGDLDIWEEMKNDTTGSFPYLGDDYDWEGAVNREGNSDLSFQNGASVTVTREASAKDHPAHWSMP